MTERAPSFSAYFPGQDADPKVTNKREVCLDPGNYYIYGSSFIGTKALTSDEGQAIYVRNPNPIFLAAVLCRFQNLYTERRGAAINFQSSPGGICIDKCTGNDCNAVKGAQDTGYIAGGQFADLDPSSKVNMTSLTECSSRQYFDENTNHPERPFSFNKGTHTINSVNISDCYCWHINGFFLSGTLESARYITASGGKTDSIMFWFENVQNPVVEYVTVQQMTITNANKRYAFIFAKNCSTVTFDYLTVNGVSVTGKYYLFTSESSDTSFNLNHNYISNRDDWDIISIVAATDNRTEPIPDDHSYFTEEQLNSTLDPQPTPTQEHETPTQEHETSTQEHETPTQEHETPTQEHETPTENNGEPTRSPEGRSDNQESNKIGNLDKNIFIIIIVVCAVILILIIVIVAIVILRRKKDIKEDNYKSSSSEFKVPEAPASTVVPETVFPTETVQTEAGMWTTDAYENDDPFKPELENSSSDSPDVQIDNI